MKQTMGGVLIAVGILISGASGLCSLSVLFSSGELAGFGMLPAVLVFGGIPFAIGAAIACGGRSLIRQARRDAERQRIDHYPEIFE